MPDSVLRVAAVKSREMEEQARAKRLKALAHTLQGVVQGNDAQDLQDLVTRVEEL